MLWVLESLTENYLLQTRGLQSIALGPKLCFAIKMSWLSVPILSLTFLYYSGSVKQLLLGPHSPQNLIVTICFFMEKLVVLLETVIWLSSKKFWDSQFFFQHTTEFLFGGGKMIITKANCEILTKLNNHFNSKIMPLIPLVLKWTISSERIVDDSFFFQALS